jgi:hypothetical protein
MKISQAVPSRPTGGWRELTVYNAIGSEKEVTVSGTFNYTTKEQR